MLARRLREAGAHEEVGDALLAVRSRRGGSPACELLEDLAHHRATHAGPRPSRSSATRAPASGASRACAAAPRRPRRSTIHGCSTAVRSQRVRADRRDRDRAHTVARWSGPTTALSWTDDALEPSTAREPGLRDLDAVAGESLRVPRAPPPQRNDASRSPGTARHARQQPTAPRSRALRRRGTRPGGRVRAAGCAASRRSWSARQQRRAPGLGTTRPCCRRRDRRGADRTSADVRAPV